MPTTPRSRQETSKCLLPALASSAADIWVPGAGSHVAAVATIGMEVFEFIRRHRDRTRPMVAEEIGMAFRIINERVGLTVQKVLDEDANMTALLEVLRAAERKHDRVSLVRLRYALVSSVINTDIDSDRKIRLTKLCGELSDRHVMVLAAMHDAIVETEEVYNGAQDDQTLRLWRTPFTDMQASYDTIPNDLQQQIPRMLFRVILRDLDNESLLHMGDADDFESFRSGRTGLLLESSTVRPIALTTLGLEFLRHVSGHETCNRAD